MKKVLILFLLMVSPAFALDQKGFETLNVFTKILNYVENDYVEKVDDQRLLRGAIRGMLSTLDPHTVYLSPEVYKELKADTSGIFGGVGLEITIRGGWVTIVSAVEGTPAFRAGVQPGDRILKIDGQSTKEMDLSDAVKAMRGKKGSKVTLTISRLGQKQLFNIVVVREVVKVPSVHAELLEHKYPYIKISSFQERTNSDLKKALKKYENEVKTNGLILDLRNNPGGLLEQAVQVCSEFLDSGVVVITESRKKEVEKRAIMPEPDRIPVDFPLIILVNGGSASASEIVAGALQDHKRAVIMGTQTFGKGSVQSVVELDDGSALKITIARYYTPDRHSIQSEGVKPDVVVAPSPEVKTEGTLIRLREEHLKGHLKGAFEEEKEKEHEKVVEYVAPPPIGAFDYQRKAALDYLKDKSLFEKAKKKK